MSADVADLFAETRVSAPVERVWALVSDPAAMTRWSPEGLLIRPLGAVRTGGRTLNLNRRGFVVWPTVSRITRFEPPRVIAWAVGASGTEWSLELEPDGDATVLRHRRRLLRRPRTAVAFAGALLGGVDAHDAELAAGMHRTLGAIRAEVEGATARG